MVVMSTQLPWTPIPPLPFFKNNEKTKRISQAENADTEAVYADLLACSVCVAWVFARCASYHRLLWKRISWPKTENQEANKQEEIEWREK